MINPITATTGAIKNFIDKRIPFEYNIDSNDEIAKLTEAIYLLCSYVEFDTGKK